mgnify:CR=1 FL=1
MGIKEHVEEEIMAFVPEYVDMLGNSTIVYTYKGGKKVVNKSIKTYINSLGKYFMLDLKELKKYYGNILGVSKTVPIPFAQNYVFIPFKTRVPLCKNDGAYGYVNIDYIENVAEVKGHVVICLKSSWEICSLSSKKSVEKYLKQGLIVKELCMERKPIYTDERDFYEEYDKPATKGDIAMLRGDIIKIMETLN